MYDSGMVMLSGELAMKYPRLTVTAGFKAEACCNITQGDCIQLEKGQVEIVDFSRARQVVCLPEKNEVTGCLGCERNKS